jgi:hypothetical protein
MSCDFCAAAKLYVTENPYFQVSILYMQYMTYTTKESLVGGIRMVRSEE